MATSVAPASAFRILARFTIDLSLPGADVGKDFYSVNGQNYLSGPAQ